MATKYDHIHRYYRLGEIWRCAVEGCAHFVPKHYVPAMVGRKSKCNTRWGRDWCENTLIIDEDHLNGKPGEINTDKPICFVCLTEWDKQLIKEFNEKQKKEKEAAETNRQPYQDMRIPDQMPEPTLSDDVPCVKCGRMLPKSMVALFGEVCGTCLE